jgi:F0F1-type ATP synthase assembly protein I
LRQEIRELVVSMVAKRNNAINVALAVIAGIIVGVLIK